MQIYSEKVRDDQDGQHVFILKLAGRLDVNSAPQFESCLLELDFNFKKLVLDFEGIDYVSSAGYRVILVAKKMTMNKKCALTLKQVSASVMQELSMLGIHKVLEFE